MCSGQHRGGLLKCTGAQMMPYPLGVRHGAMDFNTFLLDFDLHFIHFFFLLAFLLSHILWWKCLLWAIAHWKYVIGFYFHRDSQILI